VAIEAGVLLGGDVIVSRDGRLVAGSDAFAQAVAGHPTGPTVTVSYLRGRRRTARVRLGTRPPG
jgi:S1-C subfamily serine protease